MGYMGYLGGGATYFTLAASADALDFHRVARERALLEVLIMRQRFFMCILHGTAFAASLAFSGQLLAQTQADKDRAALRQFPEVNKTVKDVAPIIDKAARNHAETSAAKATGNTANVTSRDRPANSPIASPAHDRGAIDVNTKNMSNDAGKISKEVGKGYTTIHETPHKGGDTHSVYSEGKNVKTSEKPSRATGEHIHVQPDFNKRLHEAGSEPKKGKSDTEARAINSSNRGTK